MKLRGSLGRNTGQAVQMLPFWWDPTAAFERDWTHLFRFCQDSKAEPCWVVSPGFPGRDRLHTSCTASSRATAIIYSDLFGRPGSNPTNRSSNIGPLPPARVTPLCRLLEHTALVGTGMPTE